ncbi:hypothetical protein AAFF_G00441480 [Aldrovandia affinis]|uniref:Uncharacterized protein n=1 Tax=Aldrovandia affinis TaxID=143900 RepID=A0AAD7S7F5_9TELE|nr:hypothetical protein AAFF_G00441480 [Aldrovandia affinis]
MEPTAPPLCCSWNSPAGRSVTGDITHTEDDGVFSRGFGSARAPYGSRLLPCPAASLNGRAPQPSVRAQSEPAGLGCTRGGLGCTRGVGTSAAIDIRLSSKPEHFRPSRSPAADITELLNRAKRTKISDLGSPSYLQQSNSQVGHCCCTLKQVAFKRGRTLRDEEQTRRRCFARGVWFRCSYFNMGCGSSASAVVRPAGLKGHEQDSCAAGKSGAFSRGESAVSKQTNDSGLGQDATEGPVPLPAKLSPLPVPSPALGPALGPAQERQPSSDIMEQLLNQGIISATPKVGGAGEAYSLMMDRPLQRPPARLESLKTSTDKPVTSKEDIEDKMKRVEERRMVKEAELRQRLRSARLRGTARPQEEEEEDEGASDQEPTPAPKTPPPKTPSSLLAPPARGCRRRS